MLTMAAVVLCVLIAGCRDEPEQEQPVGSFVAYVDGVLADTLEGAASFVRDERGRVGALELDAVDSTEGFSLELEPLPPAPRTYVVHQRRPSNAAPTVRAFLDVQHYSFLATAGTLHVEEASARHLLGSFRFEMEAPVEVPFDEPQPVTVQGQFEATPSTSPSSAP